MKVALSLLIDCMLTHGFSLNDLLEAVIVSITKDMKVDLCSDDNYRGIDMYTRQRLKTTWNGALSDVTIR